MIITGLTAARMIAIEAASIVDGNVVGSNLILVKHDGSTIDAGNVRGPQGVPGDVDRASVQTITGAKTFTSKVTIAIGGNGSVLRLGCVAGADSLNIDAYGASAVTLASGADFDGTTSTARATSAAQLEMINGAFNFYMNTGLTAGNTFTRTQKVNIDNNGEIFILRPTAGVSLYIGEEAASMLGGSIVLTRSVASSRHESIVFATSLVVDYIVGREANSDDLKFGTSAGGVFTEKVRFDTTGQMKSIGTLNLFGGGVFGADQSAVGLGQYDADDALISTYQPVRANCSIIMQSKGSGSIILRNGGTTTNFVTIDNNAKVFINCGNGGAVNSIGLEVFSSPNATYSVIKGRTAWGAGNNGGYLIDLGNSVGTVFAVRPTGKFLFGSSASVTAATANAGGGATLPATVATFFIIELNGVDYKVPMYAN